MGDSCDSYPKGKNISINSLKTDPILPKNLALFTTQFAQRPSKLFVLPNSKCLTPADTLELSDFQVIFRSSSPNTKLVTPAAPISSGTGKKKYQTSKNSQHQFIFQRRFTDVRLLQDELLFQKALWFSKKTNKPPTKKKNQKTTHKNTTHQKNLEQTFPRFSRLNFDLQDFV